MERSNPVYLPLFFNLTDQPCLVVGGGEVGQRKAEQLLHAGAVVTVIAPEIVPEFETLLVGKACSWESRQYVGGEASGYRLVIATTDDAEINRMIYEDCQAHGIPVNVVDQPELCSVIFASTVRRGFVTMAISSGGQAPFFTKALRKELEAFVGKSSFLDKPQLLVAFREFVRKETDDPELKEKAYERLLASSEEEWSQWSEKFPPYETWGEWLKELDA
jgi:uroporphyrin-III C-methyltransferase/precorrin-2 dehydrogenase/sirohydrochlorin ferrochelatase